MRGGPTELLFPFYERTPMHRPSASMTSLLAAVTMLGLSAQGGTHVLEVPTVREQLYPSTPSSYSSRHRTTNQRQRRRRWAIQRSNGRRVR